MESSLEYFAANAMFLMIGYANYLNGMLAG